MFAIKCTKGKEAGSYVATDHSSGGYPYWGTFRNADLFNSVEDAKKVLGYSDFTHETLMSGGSINPPHMLYSAAGLCNTLKSNDVEISIVEIKEVNQEVVISKRVSFK